MWKIVAVTYSTVTYGNTHATFEDAVKQVYKNYEPYVKLSTSPVHDQPFAECDFSGQSMIDYVERYLIRNHNFVKFRIMQLPCVALLHVNCATIFAVRVGFPCPFLEGPRQIITEGPHQNTPAIPGITVWVEPERAPGYEATRAYPSA
jgi:hypothetical protein